MRRMILAGAMALLLGATVARATQVDVVGMAVRDASNQLVSGTHTVTLTIYDASTGGTSQWSQNYTGIGFSSRVFLMTSVQLPTIYIDSGYWIALTVDNTGHFGNPAASGGLVEQGVNAEHLGCDRLLTRRGFRCLVDDRGCTMTDGRGSGERSPVRCPPSGSRGPVVVLYGGRHVSVGAHAPASRRTFAGFRSPPSRSPLRTPAPG